jgi:hypothetical protein
MDARSLKEPTTGNDGGSSRVWEPSAEVMFHALRRIGAKSNSLSRCNCETHIPQMRLARGNLVG